MKGKDNNHRDQNLYQTNFREICTIPVGVKVKNSSQSAQTHGVINLGWVEGGAVYSCL